MAKDYDKEKQILNYFKSLQKHLKKSCLYILTLFVFLYGYNCRDFSEHYKHGSRSWSKSKRRYYLISQEGHVLCDVIIYCLEGTICCLND